MRKLRLAHLNRYRAVSIKILALLVISSATVLAQQQAGGSTQDQDTGEARGIPVTLAGQFFDHDFVNYFAFGNFVYDSNVGTVQGNQSSSGSGVGFSLGGGVTASHTTQNSVLSLSYRGAWRHYGSVGFGSGTDQNLALDYSRRLSRRWSMSANAGAGILFYGGGFYSIVPAAANTITPNPFSSESRFLTTGLNFSYQMTRRLSVVFGGQFFLNNYNYAGAINSVGTSGQVSLVYRLTPKTNIAGTYSHSYYTYGQNVGNTNLDTVSLTLSRIFPRHWQGSISAGGTRSHTSGVISIPVSIIVDGQPVSGYIVGPYDRISYIPSVQGTLTHYLRRSSFSVTAGQGVTPGNGYFLTSRNQFLYGNYSYSTRRSNISFGGGYSRLSSVANNVSQGYNTGTFSASYSRVLRRYLSANFRYDLISYGSVSNNLGNFVENRISVGLSLSSKSVPLTLF